MAIENNDYDAMNNLGVLYYEQGKFELAEKYAKMAYESGDNEAIDLLDKISLKQKK